MVEITLFCWFSSCHKKRELNALFKNWARQDSNLRPRDYESPALPLRHKPISCCLLSAVPLALPTSRQEHLVLSSAECHKPISCCLVSAVSLALPTSRQEHLILSSAECHKPISCCLVFVVSPALPTSRQEHLVLSSAECHKLITSC